MHHALHRLSLRLRLCVAFAVSSAGLTAFGSVTSATVTTHYLTHVATVSIAYDHGPDPLDTRFDLWKITSATITGDTVTGVSVAGNGGLMPGDLFRVMPGTTYNISGMTGAATGGYSFSVYDSGYPFFTPGSPPPTYGVTFDIPFNGTGHALIWVVKQGGTVVATYEQTGTAATTIYVGGLASPSPTPVLYLVDGGDINVDPVTGNFVGVTGGTTMAPKNLGVTPTVETSPGSGASAHAGGTAAPPPATPLLPALPPTPTVPASPVAPPTPTDVPFPGGPVVPPALPTPTGGSPVTTGDSIANANQITQAITNADSRAVTSANAIVTSVNNAALAFNTGANGIIAAVNKATTAVDGINLKLGQNDMAQATRDSIRDAKIDSVKGAVDTTNSKLDTIAGKLDSIKDGSIESPTATTARLATVAAANTAGIAAKGAVEGLFGTAATGKGYALSAGGAPSLSVAMPSAFGGQTFDFNPFTSDRLGPVVTWFRAAVEWLAVVVFGAWLWSQLGDWVRGVGSVRQAHGNAVVAGTGAQATAFIAAAAIAVAVIAALTLLLAWSFDSLNLAALVSATTTNPMATIPAGAYWMLDQVLPVSVLITCALGRLTFNLYAAKVYAGVAILVRFFVP